MVLFLKSQKKPRGPEIVCGRKESGRTEWGVCVDWRLNELGEDLQGIIAVENGKEASIAEC